MLKNVISEYFIQKVFSFLTEYPKLKMVKYNKNMQKNLEINIPIITIVIYPLKNILLNLFWT